MNRLASMAIALCVLSGAGWTARDYAGIAGVKRQAQGGAATNTWDDYSHYWHPGKYTNGMDYGNAATKLNATNISGTVTISSRGWTFPTTGNNGITLPSAISNSTAYSFAFWAASPGYGSTGGWVLSDRSNTSTESDFQIVIAASGWVPGLFNTAGTFYEAAKASPGTNWQHIVVAAGSSNVTLYIDGTAATNFAYAGTLRNASTRTRIGNYSWDTGVLNAFGYRGDLDKLQFWNRKLTATEAAGLAAQSRTE
jgi:hypothetical protein